MRFARLWAIPTTAITNRRLDRSGHREINWDGGNTANVATMISGNPFDGFLVTRGALFTTDGTGFVQAPPAGLADVNVFNNPTYGTIFKAFSLSRLFSAIGSNITEVDFFVPGGGNIPATVTGFGAVFTDVDQPDGSGPSKKRGNRGASTLIEYFGADGKVLFSSFVPASPGDGSLSFFGIKFDDALIARVRITSGNVAPGPDDDGEIDIVMMDDFIYGEPQPLTRTLTTEATFGELPSGSLSWRGNRHQAPRTMTLAAPFGGSGK